MMTESRAKVNWICNSHPNLWFQMKTQKSMAVAPKKEISQLVDHQTVMERDWLKSKFKIENAKQIRKIKLYKIVYRRNLRRKYWRHKILQINNRNQYKSIEKIKGQKIIQGIILQPKSKMIKWKLKLNDKWFNYFKLKYKM